MSVYVSVQRTLSHSLAALAMTLLAGQATHAQGSKADKKSSNSENLNVAADSTGIEQVADTEPASIRNAQSGTSTLNSNTVTPDSTSTANLAKAIEKSSPRRWFGEFYSETYTQATDLQAGKGSPKFDSYAGVKYDLGAGQALSLRQNFDYTGLTAVGANTLHVQDLAINYINGKVAHILGDGDLIVMGRLYLPTGENSRFLTKRAGAERIYLIGTKSYGKLDLTYLWLGQVANFTQDSYPTIAAGVTGEKQNGWLIGVHEFDAFYNLTSKFAIGTLVGQELDRNRPLAGQNDVAANLYLEPVLQFSPVKGLTFQAAVYNEINTYNPTHDFAFMREDELQYYFNVAASL